MLYTKAFSYKTTSFIISATVVYFGVFPIYMLVMSMKIYFLK
jgi:hypothetical protein